MITPAAALLDWLGSGSGPVNPMVAKFRAQRCLVGNDGKPCPNNVQPNWWDKVKHEVADWIRKQLELKHGMALKLDDDPNLHMCKVCGCCLQLKVWVPITHIRDHMTPDRFKDFPDFCWIKKELTPQ